jgi:hypothetical protein
MPELKLTLPIPPRTDCTDKHAASQMAPPYLAYRRSIAACLRGQHVPAHAAVHLSVRLFSPHRGAAAERAARQVRSAIANAMGFRARQVRELHLYYGSDERQPRAEVRVMWHTRPWHCAWCEPLPSPDATSGVCEFHRGQLMAAGSRTAA